VWLENTGTSRQVIAAAEKNKNNRKIDKKIYNDGDFYLTAARNCVRFYLGTRRNVLNSPKHSSFKAFLTLPATDAKRTNVWRWYLSTGGHPPYDPSRRY
jgi:hypothetical protein